MGLNEAEVCRDLANLHENIIAAGIIEDQHLIARYSKVADPPISDERMKRLFAQPEILIGICRNTEEFFGGLLYCIISFEGSDLIYFPARVGDAERVLYFRTERTHRGEEILQRVYDYLEKNRNN